MKIELEEKEEKKAETGDIIKLETGIITLVLEHQKMVALKYSEGSDWFSITSGAHEDCLKQGDYTILAKANEWKIVKDR